MERFGTRHALSALLLALAVALGLGWVSAAQVGQGGGAAQSVGGPQALLHPVTHREPAAVASQVGAALRSSPGSTRLAAGFAGSAVLEGLLALAGIAVALGLGPDVARPFHAAHAVAAAPRGPPAGPAWI